MRYVLIALVGVFTASGVHAETHSGSGGGKFRAKAGDTAPDSSSEPTPGGRRAGTAKMPKAQLEFVSKAFPGRTMKNLEKKYDEPMFQGLAKAVSKDGEQEIATVIARLYGGLDTKQLPDMLKAVEEEKQKADPKDEKWNAFLERVLWAAPIATGDKPVADGKAADFNAAFEDAWKIVKAKNKEFNEKLATADVNAKSKEFVKANVDKDMAMAFAAAQASKGDQAVAEKLASALALEGGKGQKYIEMIGGPGEAQRIYLGTKPEEFVNALKVAAPKLDNFENVSYVPTQHTSDVKKSWYVEGNDLKTGAPAGGEPTPVAPPPRLAQDDKKPDDKKKTEGDGGTGGSGGPEKAAAAVIASATCQKCHAPDAGVGALALKVEGGKLRGKTLKAALEQGGTNDSMPAGIREKIRALAATL